jgi:hypothetical protein
MLVAFVNDPASEAGWNVRDCVIAAAQLVDETMEVVEYVERSTPVQADALVYSGRSGMTVFPAIPLAEVAIAVGPPGQATTGRLSVVSGPPPQHFRFHPDDFGLAVADIARWLESSLHLGITETERRKLEVIRTAVQQAVDEGFYRHNPDLAAQARAVLDTLDAQMHATHPGRRVVGWCLSQIKQLPAGFVTGLASSYALELLPHFVR